MLFVGVDWGEAHHDLCLLDQDGNLLAARRIASSANGGSQLVKGGTWLPSSRGIARP